MSITASTGNQVETNSSYDRTSELKAFDDTKAGVKGLVDAGVTKVPRIFIHDQLQLNEGGSNVSGFSIPIIDLEGVNGKTRIKRAEIIKQVRGACQEWGFFQIVNHGIPGSMLDEIIDGIRRFHEWDTEEKKRFYSRDPSRNVLYYCDADLHFAESANWRDTLVCTMAPHPPKLEELPQVCRDIINEYTNKVRKLGSSLLELISEALGLKPKYLEDIGCSEGLALVGHYSPACPQPELTIVNRAHSDTAFLTMLLQDQIGGLQVFRENQWVDVTPTTGAIVVNIGEMLQLISNDMFISSYHRVLSKNIGPRISVACFLVSLGDSERLYGPIKDLLSEENPAIYPETTIKEFKAHRRAMAALGHKSALPHFKLKK